MAASFLIQWRNKVLSEDGPDSSTTRYVLLVLSKHMNRYGGSCFPSMELLARESGLSERTVGTALKEAEVKGWIKRYRRRMAKGGSGWMQYEYEAEVPERGSDTRRTQVPEASSGTSQVPENSSGTISQVPATDDEVPEIHDQVPEKNDSKYPKEIPTRTPYRGSKRTIKEDERTALEINIFQDAKTSPKPAIDFETHTHWQALADGLIKEGMEQDAAQRLVVDTADRVKHQRLALEWTLIQTGNIDINGSLRQHLEGLACRLVLW